MIAGEGDALPVSALPADGTYPTGTAQWEKRNIALEIPVWDAALCIQCGKCVLVCPHAVIRAKVYAPAVAGRTHPPAFKSAPARWREFGTDSHYTLQVAPEDCTGCGLCVEVCPVKNKSEARHKAINMAPQAPLRDAGGGELGLLPRPAGGRTGTRSTRARSRTSSCCSRCSSSPAPAPAAARRPYLKLLTQLFGDRAVIANATGCSSIYGGNLPTTPWAAEQRTAAGRPGPTRCSRTTPSSASACGCRSTSRPSTPASCSRRLGGRRSATSWPAICSAPTSRPRPGSRPSASASRELKAALGGLDDAGGARPAEPWPTRWSSKSVWIVGGDGWAYDIGYGGLDHVLASGANVNVLVLDTEVYSNTGGQMSKATPRGAVAKFAAGGKTTRQEGPGAAGDDATATSTSPAWPWAPATRRR